MPPFQMSLLRLPLCVMRLCRWATLDSVPPPLLHQQASLDPWGPAPAPQHQPVQGLKACTCASPSGPKRDRPLPTPFTFASPRILAKDPRKCLRPHALLRSPLQPLRSGLFSHCNARRAPKLLSDVGRKRNRLEAATSSGSTWYLTS